MKLITHTLAVAAGAAAVAAYTGAFQMPGAAALPAYGPAQGAIVARYADSMGYCGAKPKGKKGEVVIYWTRDELGNCSIPNYETIK